MNLLYDEHQNGGGGGGGGGGMMRLNRDPGPV